MYNVIVLNMFESFSQIVVSNLFFWTVLAYFIILYHTFDIKEIQNKLKGVELLFISIALGTIFSLIYDFLYPIFYRIYNWIESLKGASVSLPLTNNPFQPELLSVDRYLLGYFTIGLGMILFVYLMLTYSSFLIIKTIQFCFDPNKDIFTKYKRFKVFSDNNITKILLFGFPRLLAGIILFILMIDLIIGFVVNTPNLPFNLFGLINVIFALLYSILIIVIGGLLVTVLYDDILLIKPIFYKGLGRLKKYQQKSTNNRVVTKQNKVILFFEKYINIQIYFLLALMIIISTKEFIEGGIDSYTWLIISIISIITVIFIYINKNR